MMHVLGVADTRRTMMMILVCIQQHCCNAWDFVDDNDCHCSLADDPCWVEGMTLLPYSMFLYSALNNLHRQAAKMNVTLRQDYFVEIFGMTSLRMQQYQPKKRSCYRHFHSQHSDRHWVSTPQQTGRNCRCILYYWLRYFHHHSTDYDDDGFPAPPKKCCDQTYVVIHDTFSTGSPTLEQSHSHPTNHVRHQQSI